MKALLSTILSISLLPVCIGVAPQQVPAAPTQGTTPPAQGATPAPPQANAPAPIQAATPPSTEKALPAPAALPSQVEPSAANITPSTYVIGPDDNIRITVWSEPTLSGAVPVRPDGMISLALVGDIMAAGRTPTELSADITARLKKFLTDPTVAVTVLAVNSKRVFVIGEVAHIGPIPLTSSMNPLQAISAAGGPTPFAKQTHIYILRGEQGKQKKIPFNYKKAIKDGDLQGVTLLPGDTIVVP
ncbi:MAG TPA: polysaccharide biosynthesis/export family protein [Acidobacteriaceae bacterium]